MRLLDISILHYSMYFVLFSEQRLTRCVWTKPVSRSWDDRCIQNIKMCGFICSSCIWGPMRNHFHISSKIGCIHTVALHMTHSFIWVIMKKCSRCTTLSDYFQSWIIKHRWHFTVWLHLLTLTLKYTDKVFMLFNLLELTNVLVIG